jgi:hypothetical protein
VLGRYLLLSVSAGTGRGFFEKIIHTSLVLDLLLKLAYQPGPGISVQGRFFTGMMLYMPGIETDTVLV